MTGGNNVGKLKPNEPFTTDAQENPTIHWGGTAAFKGFAEVKPELYDRTLDQHANGANPETPVFNIPEATNAGFITLPGNGGFPIAKGAVDLSAHVDVAAANKGVAPPPPIDAPSANTEFAITLATLESNGQPNNGYGAWLQDGQGIGAIGRYGLRASSLKAIGWMDDSGNWTDKARANGVSSTESFRDNPAAQETARVEYMGNLKSELRANGSWEMIGQTVEGHVITEAGLIAAAWKEGSGAVYKFFSGDSVRPDADAHIMLRLDRFARATLPGEANYREGQAISEVGAQQVQVGGHWEDRTVYDVMTGLPVGPENKVWVTDTGSLDSSTAPTKMKTSTPQFPNGAEAERAAALPQINAVPNTAGEPLIFELGNGKLVRAGDDINGADGRLVSFNQATNTLVVDVKVGDNLYERRTYSGSGDVHAQAWEYAKDQIDASTGEAAQYFNGDVFKIAGDQYIFLTGRGLVHAGTGELAAAPEDISRFINQATTQPTTPPSATPAGYQTVVVGGQTYEVSPNGTINRQLPGHPGWTESRDSTGGGLLLDWYGNAVAQLQPGDKVGQMDDGRILIQDAAGKSVNRAVDETCTSAFVTQPITDSSFRVADVQTSALVGHFTGSNTGGAYNAGQLAGFDVMPLNERTSLLVNADSDIAGEINRLPNGYYQVKDLNGNAVYVNDKDGSVVASDTYTRAESSAQASQTTSALGLMNSIIGLQHWEQMSDLQRAAALASVYNVADKLTGNALPGDLGTAASVLGLLNALDKGDIGSIAYSGLSLIESLTQTFNAAGQVTQAGWVSANLPGGDSFLPGLGLVLAIDSGDPVNIASSSLSLMSSLGWIGPWGAAAGIALSVFSSLGLFGEDSDIPMKEGIAHAEWDAAGNTRIITDQDVEGGGATAAGWMRSLVDGLQERLSNTRDADGNPYALVPGLLPAIGFQYDPDGFNLANGAKGFMVLRWTDETGQLQTRYYDGAGSRGDGTGETLAGDFMAHANEAIAPKWLVQTVLAHDNQGQGLHLPRLEASLPKQLADGLHQSLQAITLALPVEPALQNALIDIDADGYLEQTQWLAGDQQVLAVDSNGDGLIGTDELLSLDGSASRHSLSWLDSNDDQLLDARDPAFAALRLWLDIHSDARSSGETQTLVQAGIAAVDFGSDPPAIVRTDGSRLPLTVQTLTGEVLGVKYQAVVGGVLQLDEQQTGPAAATLHAVNTREFDGQAGHIHGGDAAADSDASGESTVDVSDNRLVTTTARTIATQTVQASATLAANDPRLRTGFTGTVLAGQLAGQTPGTVQASRNGIVFVPAGAAHPVAQIREATVAMVRSAETVDLVPLMALALGAGAAQWPTLASAATPAPASDAPGAPVTTAGTDSIDWQIWDGSRFSPAPNSSAPQAPTAIPNTSNTSNTLDGLSALAGANADASNLSSVLQERSPLVGNPQVNGASSTSAFVSSLVSSSIDNLHGDALPEDDRASSMDTVLDFPQTHSEQANSREDTGLRFLATLLLANDSTVNAPAFPNQPSLRISSVFAPVHGSVSLQLNAQGAMEVVFLPEANYHGPASFDYTVTDQYGLSNNARVNLSIAAVNDAPVAMGETTSGDEDTTLLFTAASLLANDLDVDTAVDGDVLRITRVGLAEHGQVFLQPDGTVRFMPDADYNGPARFSYWVGDRDPAAITAGVGYETQATVNLTVLAVNDLPVVTGEVMGSDEDVVLLINPALLLANDTDVDAAPFNAGNAEPDQVLSITAVGAAQHGSIALLADGTLQFTPESNYFGAAGFSYTVDDGQGGQVTGQVVVNLAPVNDAPDVLGETITFNEDEVQTFAEASLLANDSDVDNGHQDLRIVSVDNATHGSASLNPDGSIRFAPDADYFGPAQFTYTVTDGVGGFTVGLACLDIAAVNDAPRLLGETTTLDEDTQARFTASALLANDTDVDNLHADLTIRAAGNASHGSVQMVDGEIVFTPDLNFNGTASFGYTVSDGVGGESQATVNLTFNPVNDVPVTNDELLMGKRDVSYTLTQAALLANDTDVESPAALHISAISNVQHGTAVLNANGSVSFVPEAGYAGRGSFDYTVQDPEGASSIATASIDFSRINRNPVATDDSFTGYEDVAFSIAQAQLLVNDTDPDAGALSTLAVDAVGQASHGSVSLQADGSVRFAPDADYNGGTSFAYRINDGEGGQTWATAYLNVQSVNDAPIIEDIWYGRPLYGYQMQLQYDGSGGYSTTYTSIYDQAQAAPLATSGQLFNKVVAFSSYDSEGYLNVVYQYPQISPSYYRNGHLRPVGTDPLDATRYDSDGNPTLADDLYRQNGTVEAYDPDGNSSAISFGVAAGPQHGHAWTNQYTSQTAPTEIDHTQAAYYAVAQTGAWQYYSQRGDGYDGADPFAIAVTDGDGATTNVAINAVHKSSQVSGGGGKKPVTLDLTGNGLQYIGLDDSKAYFDVNNDDWREHLAWVASDDGLLVRDIGSDGVIDRFDEISFTHYQPGAKSDLEGLTAFDSNRNGLLDRLDARWREFGVWQDSNGDGVTQTGEFNTLDHIGITQISLHSDQQFRQPVQGVTELGQSHFTWADGHTGAVGDVVLAVESLQLMQAAHSVPAGQAAQAGDAAVDNTITITTAATKATTSDISSDTTPATTSANFPADPVSQNIPPTAPNSASLVAVAIPVSAVPVAEAVELVADPALQPAAAPAFWPTPEHTALLMAQMVSTITAGWEQQSDSEIPLVYVPAVGSDTHEALLAQSAPWEQMACAQTQLYPGAA